MLQKFGVRNYRNFQEQLIIDFGSVGGYKFNTECVTNDTIAKMLIYGSNATGKTNLGRALRDIKYTLNNYGVVHASENIVNANSEENTCEFTYEFRFDSVLVDYIYEKDEDDEVVKESLFIDKKCCYAIDYRPNFCIYNTR